MDKQAKRKHLKELKRKRVLRNIRLFGKQMPMPPKPRKMPLSFEELAKIVGLND